MELLQQTLQQYGAEGFDDSEAFEDLVDWFEQAEDEAEMDLALPVITGFAIRSLARPLARQAGGSLPRPVRQQLVRGATQAARTLVNQQGPQAVRALPRIARSVARAVARQPARPVPQAARAATRSVQRRVQQVAARPGLY